MKAFPAYNFQRLQKYVREERRVSKVDTRRGRRKIGDVKKCAKRGRIN